MKMTVKSTGAELRAVWYDKEVLECARLNMRTKKRLEMIQKAKEQKMRFKREMEKNANHILFDVLVCGAVAVAGRFGLIHPVLWVPLSLIAVCGACVRLGVWFSKAVK